MRKPATTEVRPTTIHAAVQTPDQIGELRRRESGKRPSAPVSILALPLVALFLHFGARVRLDLGLRWGA